MTRKCFYMNEAGLCQCEESPCRGKLCLTCGKMVEVTEQGGDRNEG